MIIPTNNIKQDIQLYLDHKLDTCTDVTYEETPSVNPPCIGFEVTIIKHCLHTSENNLSEPVCFNACLYTEYWTNRGRSTELRALCQAA